MSPRLRPAKCGTTVTERVDRFQRRHPGVGFPLAVLYKFGDDDGHFLAALIAYYGFLALFPLLLLLTTVLGCSCAGIRSCSSRCWPRRWASCRSSGRSWAAPTGSAAAFRGWCSARSWRFRLT
jgi:hypothetical protein